MRKVVSSLVLVMSVAVLATITYAQGTCTREDVLKSVEAAVATLEQEGTAGLEKVGQLRFCGDNYVFVNDLGAKTLMHINTALIGKILIGLKDDTGKVFFADFTKTVQGAQSTKNGKTYYNGSGWVSYRWPKKPGEKEFFPKNTYVKGCLMGDENVYVGAGIYE